MKNTRILISLAILTAALSSAAAQVRRETRTGEPVARRVSDTLRLMNMRVPEVAFEDVPLEQVMDWLQDLTATNVTVRWEVLSNNGIERDKPITMKLKNLRLSQVLWLLMSEAGGTDVKLAYRATGNLIVFSTHEDLGKDMVTKVYDVSDLLVNVPRFSNAASLNPAQALNQIGQGSQGGGGQSQLFEDTEQGGGEGGLGGEGEFGGGGGGNDMQRLIQLIRDTIEPDSWAENGGTGTITPLRNQIIVRNSILVHQLLGGYVNEDEVLSR